MTSESIEEISKYCFLIGCYISKFPLVILVHMYKLQGIQAMLYSLLFQNIHFFCSEIPSSFSVVTPKQHSPACNQKMLQVKII